VILALSSLVARAVVAPHAARQVPDIVTLLVAVFQLGLVVLGALIASRQPRNPIGWLLAGYGFTACVAFFIADTYAYLALQGHVHLPGPAYALLFESVITGPGIFGVFALVFLIFPNGYSLTPRWRFVTGAAVIATIGAMVASAISPGPLNNVTYSVQNPLGTPALKDLAGALDSISFSVLLVTMVAGAFSLVLRFRRARGDERQQLKWVATAVAFAAVLLLSGPLFWFSVIPAPFDSLWGPVFVLAAVIVPASIGIAMLKYRLYDIDVIINRALVYGPLTVTIAVFYVGGVIGLQALSRAAIGQHSDLAIAVVTLAVAALFNPWRHRLQSFIDRRFYRRKYDATRTLAAFSARLRDEVDLDTLSQDLISVLQETVQPAKTAIWLPEQERTA
jgi:hypothetical protein